MLLDWFIKKCRGYVLVRLSGKYTERFFNLVNVRCIYIWNIRKSGEDTMFYIYVKDIYRLKDILRKSKMKIHIMERYGLPFFLFFYRKRKMFVLGLLSSWIMIYIMSLYIWNISFEGNMTHTDDELMKFMESIYIKEGMKQSDIKPEEIEKAIRNKFFDITWASVEVRGTKLKIHIRENSSQVQENEDADKQTVSKDMIANKNAVIVSIVTRKGTPLVKVGDVVSKGDMLIQGKYSIYADDLTVIEERNVCADGDVVGKVVYSVSEEIKREYIKKVYTGEEYTVKTMMFDGNILKFTLPWQYNKYEKFDSISEYHGMIIGDSFYLPVSSGEIIYKEYELVEDKHTDEELKSMADKKVEYILKKLDKNTIQILDNNVKIEVNDEKCIISGEIIVLEYIGSNGGTYE